MKLAMVVTKLTGNEENDRARAQEYCRYAAHKGVIPVSAYLYKCILKKGQTGSYKKGHMLS